MASLSVAAAKDAPILFDAAHRFLLPKEKYCCSLMQRVTRQDKGIHLVLREDGTAAPVVLAVFLYNGSTVLPLIASCPEQDDIVCCLSLFFRDADVSCVSGQAESVMLFREALRKSRRCIPDEERRYVLMECAGPEASALASDGRGIRCAQPDDEECVFRMHAAFLREEVVPEWRKDDLPQILAGERLVVSRAISGGTVFVHESGGTIVSKAQETAETETCVLVGGVYTNPCERGKGYAKSLVRFLSERACVRGKRAVLFAQETNEAALRCYADSGFVPFGKQCVLYYRK